MSTTGNTTLSHRAVCLDRLARAIHAPSDRYQAWQGILMRRLCLVLWELPLQVQVGLAVATAERYLPAFERKHPHLTQLRQFFVRCLTADPPTDFDVETWATNLSEEDAGDLADSALRVAASRVAQATRETNEPTEVTSACMLSVVNAIGAGEDEVWMAVDPEAAAARLADLRRDDDEEDVPPLYHPLKYKSPWHYPEVRNAVYAGWDAVVAWLRAADVEQYPDHVDRKKLAWMLRELKRLPRVIHPPYPDKVQRDGQYAALTLATGGEPDLWRFERWAETIEEVRRGVARGGLSYGIQPTEEDVRAARDLVRLVRDGAPREALVEAAWRVYRFTADPAAVDSLLHVLPWLAGVEGPPPYATDEAMPPEVVCEWLDDGAAFFERGGNVRGFVPTAEDLTRVRRVRELVTAEGAEEVAERQRLAKELLERLPPRWWDDGEPEAAARRSGAET